MSGRLMSLIVILLVLQTQQDMKSFITKMYIYQHVKHWYLFLAALYCSDCIHACTTGVRVL